jgi:predicted nucleotidyltransferase
MSVPSSVTNDYPELSTRCILAGYRGSIAHGMYVPPKEPTSIDDKDVMYITVPPIDHYYGLKIYGSRGTREIKRNEWDIVVYEAKKFISLLEQGNPNVLMMLWLQPNYYLRLTEAGQMLIDNRSAFVGRHVYHSFTGYAHGQLHRMTHNAFQGHMGDKRRQLVEKFGFDTKNAAHLVRLLRMGIEFLKDGNLQVAREDASQLLEIKKGEWELDKIMSEADRLFAVAEQSYLSSTLPEKPDKDRVNALSVEVVRCAMLDLGEA